jgi:hypothetical protein
VGHLPAGIAELAAGASAKLISTASRHRWRNTMREMIPSMSMSLDEYVDRDRQHPGAPPERDELVQWTVDCMKGAAAAGSDMGLASAGPQG